MSFLGLFWFVQRPSAAFHRLVREVVQRCGPALHDRVHENVVGMTPAEVRGYVRARAAEVVAAGVDEILTERGADDHLGPVLAAHATETLVPLIASELCRPKSGGPETREAA